MQTYQLLAVSWYVLRNSRFGARVAAQAGSVFCENLLAAFAFTPWLRLGYSAPLRCACGAPRVLRTTYGAGFAGRATSFWLRPERVPSGPLGLPQPLLSQWPWPPRGPAAISRLPAPRRGRGAGLCPHPGPRPPVRYRSRLASESRAAPPPCCRLDRGQGPHRRALRGLVAIAPVMSPSTLLRLPHPAR